MKGNVIAVDDPAAVRVADAIHRGELTTLQRLLDDNPYLATARYGDDADDGMTRSLLHADRLGDHCSTDDARE